MSTPVPSDRHRAVNRWLDHPTGPGTLGRRLVIGVSAIVALVAVVLATITAFATHRILISQLDHQIDTASQRMSRRPGSNPCLTEIAGPAPGADVLGNVVGSIFVAQCADGSAIGSVVTEGRVKTSTGSPENTISPSARASLSTLLNVSADGHKHNLDLEDLGDYRVIVQSRDGATYAVALPMGDINRALRILLMLEAAGVLLAVGISVVISRAVVVSNLKPLNRLAGLANDVSALDLGSGEVKLQIRVAPALADPRTEVGQVGSAFNHMMDNVEGALAARQRSETRLRQFVADASHELRNPLASIRGYAELIHRSDHDLSEDTAHSLARMQAQATRMSRLVEDMLLLARLDDDQELDLRPTDLVEIVANAVSDSHAAGRDHTWALDLPDEPVTVDADPDRLTQSVINVLSNARKHTPAGTHVHTRVTAGDGSASVVVADDGPGIPEAVRDTVFERFARADSARTGSTEGSTGLGLSIVAAVMQAHHGTATLDSGDTGTTVTLTLPLASSTPRI